MQILVDKDPEVNDQRLRDIRRIADNAGTDGTCFAYGELFVTTETIEVRRSILLLENFRRSASYSKSFNNNTEKTILLLVIFQCILNAHVIDIIIHGCSFMNMLAET